MSRTSSIPPAACCCAPPRCRRRTPIALNGHALQCRITTEDPENGFLPDYGTLTAYRSAAGFGVRLDAGTAYGNAVITPYYDSLLVKVTTWAPTSKEAIQRMDRSLREFRIRGVASNLQFLENVINHPAFANGEVTTRFIDTTPELLAFAKRRDRATKLLRYLGDVTLNGHPEMKGRKLPELPCAKPVLPRFDLQSAPPKGTRDRLRELGPEKFAQWMLEQKQVLLTDTTMRDAHQSLFATRMRTADMLPIAPFYARELSQLFSLECWGGATFDVALRFLKEDPWARLGQLRERIPNVMFQMLLRGSNAVGYTNYPDNVVRFFVKQAASHGVDLFRVFDSLNWVTNMRVSIDAVREAGGLCEGAICYTGDLFDGSRSQVRPQVLRRHRARAAAGRRARAGHQGHGGHLPAARGRGAGQGAEGRDRPAGALPHPRHQRHRGGVGAGRDRGGLRCGRRRLRRDERAHLAAEPLGHRRGARRAASATLACLPRRCTRPRCTGRACAAPTRLSRATSAPARPTSIATRCPAASTPTCASRRASLGIEHRWTEVSQAYADVNKLFGDIVKVTPTSKVVGDMALMMVANDLTAEDVRDPAREISFPESVVSLFKGELGFPPDGFPAELSRKVLKAEPPEPYRPGERLAELDLEAARAQGERECAHKLDDRQLASYLMYPKVARDYFEHRRQFGDTSVLSTTELLLRHAPAGGSGDRHRSRQDAAGDACRASIPTRTRASFKVQYELNGQSRTVRVEKAAEKAGASTGKARRQTAEAGNPLHVAAPMPGSIVTVAVKPGQRVQRRQHAAVARGDEDGNAHDRRARLRDREGAGGAWRSGAGEGSVDRVEGIPERGQHSIRITITGEYEPMWR